MGYSFGFYALTALAFAGAFAFGAALALVDTFAFAALAGFATCVVLTAFDWLAAFTGLADFSGAFAAAIFSALTFRAFAKLSPSPRSRAACRLDSL
jgi:hypothetical protein